MADVVNSGRRGHKDDVDARKVLVGRRRTAHLTAEIDKTVTK